MLERVIASLCLVAVLLVLALPIAAHSGRTDAAGGHYDHSNGTYHYHHGMSAHQHPGGVCPYTPNALNGSNNSSSSSKQNSITKPKVTAATPKYTYPTVTLKPSETDDSSESNTSEVGIICLVLVGVAVLVWVGASCFGKKK